MPLVGLPSSTVIPVGQMRRVDAFRVLTVRIRKRCSKKLPRLSRLHKVTRGRGAGGFRRGRRKGVSPMSSVRDSSQTVEQHRSGPTSGVRVIEYGRRAASLEPSLSGYARCVGRVGALAIALGIGAAIASMPVAFATTGSEGSTGSSSDGSSSTGSASGSGSRDGSSAGTSGSTAGATDGASKSAGQHPGETSAAGSGSSGSGSGDGSSAGTSGSTAGATGGGRSGQRSGSLRGSSGSGSGDGSSAGTSGSTASATGGASNSATSASWGDLRGG